MKVCVLSWVVIKRMEENGKLMGHLVYKKENILNPYHALVKKDVIEVE